MFDHQKKRPFTFTRLLSMSLILSLSLSQTFGSTQSNNSSSEKKKATESKGRSLAEAGKEQPKEENVKPAAMAGKATLLGQNEKKGKFPWLIIGAATVEVGVIVVLLLTKKKESKTNTHEKYEFMMKWGGWGDGDDQFIYASGIAVDSSNYIYITDKVGFPAPAKIMKFTSDGSFVTKWGTMGSADGQFDNPNGIAVDSSGCVYVVDTGNSRIQKFRLVSSNAAHDWQNSSLSLSEKGILPTPVRTNGLKNGGSGRGNK